MYKTLLLLASLSSLLLADPSIEETRAKIKAAQAELEASQKRVAELQASIIQMEDTLPCVKEQKRECEILKKRKAQELKTHTQFGFTKTDGNTDTIKYNLDAKAEKKFDEHVFELIFDGQYAEDSNVETTNKYFTELVYGYEFTPRLSFNYLTGLKQDKFSSYDYQFYTGPGAKYKFIKTPKHNLSVASNILYSKDAEADIQYDASGNAITYPNPNNIPVASTVNGATRNYASLRTKADYSWQILKNLKFTQELTHRTDLERTHNYFLYSKTGLISKLTDIFSTGLSYKVDYVNLPASGTRHSDKTLSANLIVDY